ncbi:MAG: hypothetical protein KDD61_12695 [Bdellovibrionales bacterium]|nr:hypothetical protein [Bdellovibrionales bacterium]
MKKTKIKKVYEDYGCGFSVKLINAPMVQIRGEWVLDVNPKKLHEAVLNALVFKPSRLTGAEILFIRQYFQMTLKEFGEKFDVTHPAVRKWEETKNKATEMKWSIDKDIRLFALTGISKKARDFLEAYRELNTKAANNSVEIKINLDNVA